MEEGEEKDGLHGSEFRRLPDEILLKIVDLAAPNRVLLVNVMRRQESSSSKNAPGNLKLPGAVFDELD